MVLYVPHCGTLARCDTCSIITHTAAALHLVAETRMVTRCTISSTTKLYTIYNTYIHAECRKRSAEQAHSVRRVVSWHINIYIHMHINIPCERKHHACMRQLNHSYVNACTLVDNDASCQIEWLDIEPLNGSALETQTLAHTHTRSQLNRFRVLHCVDTPQRQRQHTTSHNPLYTTQLARRRLQMPSALIYRTMYVQHTLW